VASQTSPRAPQITHLTQPADLVATRTDDLLDGDQREGERYDGAQLSGRDLEHTSFIGCAFHRVSLDRSRLRGAHFADVTLSEIEAAELGASRSSWRSVELTSSRLGAVELYESQWRSVVVTGCKISFLNARSAKWQDVIFRDCTFDELDLGSATVARLSFERCQVKTLDLAHAKLADVDLRGAELGAVNGLDGLGGTWINDHQLSDLAPLLAAHLKINIS